MEDKPEPTGLPEPQPFTDDVTPPRLQRPDFSAAQTPRFGELFYSRSNFVVETPAPHAGFHRLHTAYQDPFNSILWLGRAHAPGKPTLRDLLGRSARLDVWLLPQRPSGLARKFSVTFQASNVRWKAIDLCSAAEEDLAMEWVAIFSAVLRMTQDVPAAEWPFELAAAIDPTYHRSR